MRHAVQAFLISGMLLAAAACGSATNPPPGQTGVGIGSATAPSTRPVDDSVRSACEALGQVYSKHIAPLAQALTVLVDKRAAGGGDKESQRQVRQSLEAFATAVRDATRTSTDPQLRADGKQAADQLQAKAADATAFSTIKTTEDVNTTLGPTLKGWLAPVEQHCS